MKGLKKYVGKSIDLADELNVDAKWGEVFQSGSQPETLEWTLDQRKTLAGHLAKCTPSL